MTIEIVREFLGWCAIINIGLLLWWALLLIFAHDFIYQTHIKWFKLSEEKFDSIHYMGVAFFKICVFVFNIVPYFALGLIG